jgi:Membrane-associated lipoprotein involved in thiamine biosynthesis
MIGMALLLASCAKQPKKMILQGQAQGSYYAITYYDEEGRNFQHEVDSIFHAIDLSVNLWVDSSIICKVNRNEDTELDRIFIDNFNIAQKAAALSDGAFDPTISPLVAAWGFSAKTSQLSSLNAHLIDSLKQLVDYRKVRIEEGKVVKEYPEMQLDFNAIAQGYTSDLISSFLESKGVLNFIVDNGGEIMARGCKPDGSLVGGGY